MHSLPLGLTGFDKRGEWVMERVDKVVVIEFMRRDISGGG